MNPSSLARLVLISGVAVVFAAGCGRRAAESPPAESPAVDAAQPQPTQATSEQERRASGEVWEDQGYDFSDSDSDSENDSLAPPPPAAPGASPEAAPATLDQAVIQLGQTGEQFNQVLQLATPDCPRAADLARTICELSKRICKLENDSINSTKQRCPDAQRRCSNATIRYDQTCSD